MKYTNTKTGVTFSSPFVISGGDWVLVDETKEAVKPDVDPIQQPVPAADPEPAATVPGAEPNPNKDNSGPADITKPEIMQELDSMGIKYKKNASKQELYDLMMQGA